ncbi:ImmA/IrrE family metallo-endopeptidase [Roseiterribacter gracilis]|uniref:IrrE N-terminal-like domain-containing protein n=1 Tax=Roseiterribacter gracilis TaxID=2812848 RepID=A0A8S8XHS3_9PROT|nr:hypothetical protein TMPK1_27870 [Rhodospirillales bacterium TMPK1]
MTPLRVRYARIESVVLELLAKYQSAKAPIDIVQIARGEGASIHFDSFDDKSVSGFLVREGDSADIVVNNGQSRERQRFTIAHELGHFKLHERAPVHVDTTFSVFLRSDKSSEGKYVAEIEANTFAASILMPSAMLRAEIDPASLDIEDEAVVAVLAKKYGVSRQAMTYRLQNLFAQSRET